MILVTIGTQLPFDRLIREVDSVARCTDEEFFGQVGNGKYKPENFPYVDKLFPHEFEAKVKEARAIIGHAGIGTVLTGQKYNKPVILMPRMRKFHEHRNDHQVATASRLTDIAGVYIFQDANSLLKILKLQELGSAVMDLRNRDSFVTNLRRELKLMTKGD